MGMTLTIGGVNKTTALQANSVALEDQLNGRNTLSCDLVDASGTYRPVVGDECILLDTDGTTRLFAGTIDEPEETLVVTGKPPALRFKLQVVDFNELADRHLVARVYENQTAGAIISDILAQDLAGEGITAGTIEAGPTIQKIVFNYVQAAAAFNELSELTGYSWWITYTKQLHFRARESVAASFAISPSAYNCRSITVKPSREQYRNRQYLRAGVDLTVARTESFVGDSATKTFLTAYPVGKVPTSVTVNGVTKTIGIRGVETGKDWYWQKSSSEISQDDAAAALTSAQTLAVTYQGQFPIIVQAQSETEITARQAVQGGTGVYEAIEDDQNIDDDDLAFTKAAALISRYGRIAKPVVIVTEVGGLRAGQLLSITVPAHNLAGQFLIREIRAQDIDGKRLSYTVTAVDGEGVGGWVQFFQRLAAARRTFVIRDNEVLLLLRTVIEPVICGDSLTVSTAAPESRIGSAQIGFSEIAA